MRERLNKLHDEEGMSWRKIAEMPEYKEKDIPAGSLCSYAAGWEPKTEKARQMFNLPVVKAVMQARNGTGRFIKRSG